MWDYRSLVDNFKEELDKIGFTDAQIWFSGFGSQGDGLCFDANVDLIKICDHLGIEYDPDKDDWKCIIDVVNPHYNNERCRRVAFLPRDPDINDHLAYQSRLDEFAEIERKIEALRVRLCKGFYLQLQDDAEAQTTQEALLESLRSRKYALGFEITRELARVAQCESIQII